MPEPPSPGEIDLWLIELDSAGNRGPDMLSEDEKLRAQKIVHDRDRGRFIAARRAIRSILSAYLGEAAESIRFRTGERGKPYLDFPITPLQFNLSHSCTRALLAISSDQAIGVDLERVQSRASLHRIALKLFDETILNRLAGLPDEAFTEAFFRHWTALEARAKAVGEGVFTFRQSRKDIHCANFEPLPGWCAAIATTGILLPGNQWRTFLLAPEISREIG
ncbi:MAG: 4'-phosphopantetheinyl transferase superfamily protein [Sedimenticola sp.]|nr:4'-phosphopantetheinyl transferase superfamily protein [Sedimenticola sp.]